MSIALPFDAAFLDTAWALALVIGVDLSMSADNAIVIALAAASLPLDRRPRVILLGTLAAALLRIILALLSQHLLSILGLTLAGGILLLYVAFKFWQELRGKHGETDLDSPHDMVATPSLRTAVIRIILADLSMSLDNVLAVAGASRGHTNVLIIGLALSVLLTGLAAGPLVRVMEGRRWIGLAGVAMIGWISLSMIYDGSKDLWMHFHP